MKLATSLTNNMQNCPVVETNTINVLIVMVNKAFCNFLYLCTLIMKLTHIAIQSHTCTCTHIYAHT